MFAHGHWKRRLTTCNGWDVQGEVLAFDSYHKRNKILYDDGEEEWVALQRELFCWLTPRALAAGVPAGLQQSKLSLVYMQASAQDIHVKS